MKQISIKLKPEMRIADIQGMHSQYPEHDTDVRTINGNWYFIGMPKKAYRCPEHGWIANDKTEINLRSGGFVCPYCKESLICEL